MQTGTNMATIESSNIIIHRADISAPFPDLLSDNDRFGILRIKMKKVKLTKKPLFLLFTIDKTGSMNEIVKLTTSKLDYVKQTFRSMLSYLAEIDVDIYIEVSVFNRNVTSAIKPIKLTKDNLNSLVDIIQELRAEDSTNLGIALQSAKACMLDYMTNNPYHEVAHIFMTDGEPTVGEKNPNILSEDIDDSYANIFVGFGFDHNATILQKFSEKKKSEYQFVDNMENTGLIYGETIHRFLYPAVKNVHIVVDNGVIYNWRKNEWCNEIEEDVFVGEIEKVYHIKNSNPENISVKLFGNNCGITYDSTDIITDASQIELLEEIYVLPSLINIETGEKQTHDEDLVKYLFRQKVQELLYESNASLSFHPDTLSLFKNKLKDSFRVLRKYMRTANLLDDPFLNQLCDDLNITYKTIGTRVGGMYSSSRQASQGMQRSYTSPRTPTIDYNLPQIGFGRQNAIARTNAMDEFDDFHQLPRTVFIEEESINASNYEGSLLDSDDIESYVSVETNISCYSTPTAINTMRSVSSGRPDN
jgi:uncharacterized protein YegL